MLPTIRPGTILAAYPYRFEHLKKGDLVLRRYMGGEVTHRLHGFVRGHGWQTKGDNNDRTDWGYLTRENFLGLVVVVDPVR